MSRSLSKLVGLIFGMIGLASSCHASIVFTLTQGSGGTVNMHIAAAGTVNATNDFFLLIGDTSDSFLPSGSPSHVGGGPVPALSMGGCTASNNFYRDDNGSNGALQSLLGFAFGCSLNGAIDLSVLNGDYNLPGSAFADFVTGTYTGLISQTSFVGDFSLQGLGDITLVVQAATGIPEPGTLTLAAFGLLAAGYAGKRRAR